MREKIIANENMILTNGEIYGKEIYLSEGVDKNTFYEITLEEYEEILKEREKEEE